MAACRPRLPHPRDAGEELERLGKRQQRRHRTVVHPLGAAASSAGPVGGARLVTAVVRDYLDDEPGTLRSISWGLGL